MEDIPKRSSITIRQGYEYRTYDSNIYSQEEFFYSAYCQAAQCISEIVYTSFPPPEESRGGFGYSGHGVELSSDQRLLSYPNNIVAFCAKRGQGKTSAMVSMSKSLEEIARDSEKDDVRTFWARARPRNAPKSFSAAQYHYTVIDPIDPTTLEPNGSILRSILSRLFTLAQEKWKDDQKAHRDQSAEQGQELLKTFTSCFRALDDLKRVDASEQYSDLTRLSEVGDNIRMKKEFSKLVGRFLKFMGFEERGMLVIQIDDADLNISRAYEIVEDIRRYCVISRVIVLMAVHLGTLRSCIEQQNVKSYEYLLRTDLAIDHMDRNQCREVAGRYIDKLLPGRHQIHLPYVEDVIREQTGEPNLYYRLASGDDLLKFDPQQEDARADMAGKLHYENRLFRLVYEKTGIILMPSNSHMHCFMPKRFRELTHFLSFFSSLENVDPSGNGSLDKLLELSYSSANGSDSAPIRLTEEERTLRENLLRLRIQNLEEVDIYLIQHWCPINLTQSQTKLIEELMHTTYAMKHTKALECIRRYMAKCQEAPDPEFSVHGAVRYTDVMLALERLKSKLHCEKHFEFACAIHLHYTIYLNKLVCTRLLQRKGLEDVTSFFDWTLFPAPADPDPSHYFSHFEFPTALFEKFINHPGVISQDKQWSDFVFYWKENRNYPLRGRNQEQDTDIRNWILNTPSETAHFDLFYALFNLFPTHDFDLVYSSPPIVADAERVCKQIASALQLICNCDVQHRIKKYCLDRYASTIKKGTTYSEWVMLIFRSIDELLTSAEDISGSLDDTEETVLKAQLSRPAPKQWLPLKSRLFELMIGRGPVANDDIRNALDAMYQCQPYQRAAGITNFTEEVIARTEKAANGIGDALISNQTDSDWWIDVRADLFQYLYNHLCDEGRQFKVFLFLDTPEEVQLKKCLTELYSTLEKFNAGAEVLDNAQMRNGLDQHRKALVKALKRVEAANKRKSNGR